MNNSSSLLIIGNGFDLNCGLKTSYKNVYEEYIVSESDSVLIHKFKNEISSDFEKWSDFELGMAEYAQKFNSENELMECTNDFNHFMHVYLSQIQQNFHKTFEQLYRNDEIKSEMNKSIQSLGSAVSHNMDALISQRSATKIENISILSFNYTDIFDYLFSSVFYGRILNFPIHIHGMLEDDPILGVDNDQQLTVVFPLTDKVRRSFIKPFFNKTYDSNRMEAAKSAIHNANTIFVYGASLGISDLTWRNELIEWLKNDKDNHLFFYRHEYSVRNFKSISERVNFEEDMKLELMKKWEMEDADVIISQLHIPCGVNIFNFSEAIRKDKETSDYLREQLNKEIPNFI